MLRSEIKVTLNGIVDALEISGVPEIFDILADLRRPTKKAPMDRAQYFEIFSKWSLAISFFSKEQQSAIEIFGLNILTDHKFWSRGVDLITADGKEGDRPDVEVYSEWQIAAQRFRLVKDFAPRILNLFEQDSRRIAEKADKSTGGRRLSQFEILTVRLPEDSDEIMPTSRIILLLEAIEGIYNTLNQIDKLVDAPSLDVTKIDSGSDKSFDFSGLGSTMQQLKEFLLGIYDRKLASRKIANSDLVDSLNLSLPAIEKIRLAVDSGTLSDEEGNLLKQGLLSGMEKFLKAGAVIPEMSDVLNPSPREIMREDRKLLEPPKDG